MSAALQCTGTPISWLRLEQHHAGPAQREITAHLVTCPACQACLDRIVADEATPLPTLELPAAPARVTFLRRAAPVLGALALAAAILFFLTRGPRVEPRELDPMSARTKGGDVSLTLVRDDDTMLVEAGGTYHDGDRWKAQVSCPPGMQASWDLVVYENGVAAFPLASPSSITCGNAVTLPGAFRTTGHEHMMVCLVWSDGAVIDREALRHLPPDALPHASCKLLDPAP